MSKELVPIIAPRALALPDEDAVALKEAFAINMASGGLSLFDLPRIKIMNGGALWVIPALEGEKTEGTLEGVIVYARDTRVYYASKDAGNTPPDCSSPDSIAGSGTPGGDCAKCPLAQWNSGENGAQACKQVKQLFMLRGDGMFPEIVTLPPTSVKAARQFFLKLTTSGVPYFHALLAIDLQKAENAQKKAYGKAIFRFLRKLTPEEIRRATDFHESMKQFASQLPAQADRQEVEE